MSPNGHRVPSRRGDGTGGGSNDSGRALVGARNGHRPCRPQAYPLGQPAAACLVVTAVVLGIAHDA